MEIASTSDEPLTLPFLIPLVILMVIATVVVGIGRYRTLRDRNAASAAREAELQAYLAERDEEWKRNHGGQF